MTTRAPALAALFARAFADPVHEPFEFTGTNGGAALLVHGFPGTPAEMRPLGTALHAAGWTARGMLLPGFGREIASLGEKRYRDWLDAVCAALRDLHAAYHPVVLIGHSMGAAVAMQAAARLHPDAVILLAPFWKIKHPLWTALPALKYAVPQFRPFRLMKPDFNNRETRQGIHNFMPDADLDDPAVQTAIRDFAIPTRLLDQLRVAGAAAYRVAPDISASTLVIQGDRDQLVAPENTEALAARIPNARFERVEGEHNLVERASPAYPAVERLVVSFAAQTMERAHAPA